MHPAITAKLPVRTEPARAIPADAPRRHLSTPRSVLRRGRVWLLAAAIGAIVHLLA